MRFARALLVMLMAIVLVACDGGEEAVPLTQRFPTAADAPGSKPDPVEKRQTPVELDEFIAAFSEAVIDPDEDMTTVFREAGFKGAGFDTRFFGETHEPTAPHLFSWSIELESEDDAEGVLDWLEADAMKPCPESCAVKINSFDVDGIAKARGVHRISTAKNIEVAGTPNQVPSDSYFVEFTLGPVVYTMDLQGPPGSVSEEQAQEIASAYYERLAGI